MLSEDEAIDVARKILEGSRGEMARLENVRTWYRGKYRTPQYIPKSETNEAIRQEYAAIIERSKVPVLDLPVETLAQNLFVDGYRPSKSAVNSKPWSHWQANRMDMKQGGLHTNALVYGASYNLILPASFAKGQRFPGGLEVPVWRPISARRLIAVYQDRLNDEWPQFALEHWSEGSPDGYVRRFKLYDSEAVYELAQDESRLPLDSDRELALTQALPGRLIAPAEPHGVGLCPVVRYLPRFDLDEDFVGMVEPLIPFQKQIDAATFYVEMAQQYAVHRQRWVTGMAIPEDEEGRPVEPFKAAIDRLWVGVDAETKFGEFGQTDTKSWLDGREATLRHLAIKSQTPPANLLGDMVNMSAEALAAAEAPRQRQAGGIKTGFGENHEQSFRLDAYISGDAEGAQDRKSQVVWRDLESRSLSQLADALGKMAQQLGIPPRALWERIPGVTDQDLERWDKILKDDDKRKAKAAAAAIGMGEGDNAESRSDTGDEDSATVPEGQGEGPGSVQGNQAPRAA